MGMKAKFGLAVCLGLALTAAAARPSEAATLKLGYSDWPGYVAWQVAIDKGWLKDAGLDVEFDWFDYGASLDAFTAGKLDGEFTTNGDTLTLGSGGTKGSMIMLTDYSSGNDTIIGRPGIKSMADLKGKKIAVEEGLVDHLLLLTALKSVGLTDADVTLVNTKTNDTPQVLASGQVDAIACWQPNSGTALMTVPGSKLLYTSADAPGLIYDVLTINPASLAAHRDEWTKLVKIWDRVVNYVNDPATQPDALKIMSNRDGLTPDTYKPLLQGTHLLTLEAAEKVYEKGDTLASLYGSTVNADAFNVKAGVYKQSQDVGSYIDPSVTTAAVK